MGALGSAANFSTVSLPSALTTVVVRSIAQASPGLPVQHSQLALLA